MRARRRAHLLWTSLTPLRISLTDHDFFADGLVMLAEGGSGSASPVVPKFGSRHEYLVLQREPSLPRRTRCPRCVSLPIHPGDGGLHSGGFPLATGHGYESQ